MSHRKPAAAIVLLGILFLNAQVVGAKDQMPGWSLKGFGSFGASGTDSNLLGFRRDLSQANGVTRSWGIDPDSRLGLQLDVDFNESWHAGAQWVARNHAGDFVEQNLDWAYLRWRPSANFALRVGRLGYDVFLLSDYRNVGYAYPWIRPPHEFYGSIPVYHFDGADIAQTFAVGAGYLTFKGFGGHSDYQLPTGGSMSVDSANAVFGGSLKYERGNWSARIGYVYTQQLQEAPYGLLTPALNSPAVNQAWPSARSFIGQISIKGKVVQFSSIGLAYDDGTWLAHMEGAYIDSTVPTYLNVVNGYLSAGRRFGPVTVYSLLGISETLNHSVAIPPPLLPIPEVRQLRDTVDYVLNTNGVDQKSVSLGVRWDVYENIALKAQWGHYWLGHNGTQLWLEPPGGIAPSTTVNVWSLGVDFMF